MGRKPALTKTEFMKQYRKTKPIRQLAAELGVTTMTVRAYLTKFGLDHPRSQEKRDREKMAAKIFKHYRGQRTLRSLAKQFGLSLVSVRYCIEQQMMAWYRSDDPPSWPIPLKVSQIKIVKELVEADQLGDSSLWDDPDQLAENTGLRRGVVDEYQKYAFEMLNKKRK